MATIVTNGSDATARLKRRLQRAFAARSPALIGSVEETTLFLLSNGVPMVVCVPLGASQNREKGRQMTRIFRALGLTLGAVLSMAAAAAPAAQAETGVMTAAEYPAIVTGQQLGGVTFDIGEAPLKTVACGTSDLEGTLVGPTDPVTLRPRYGGCIAEPGAMPVTITTNGCDYLFGVTRPGTTGTPPTTGTLQSWINCPAGQQIEIHIYENAAKHAENISLCTYDIAPQGPVPAGVYHNTLGNPNDILATVNAKFTAKSTIGPEFVCGGMGILQHLPIQLTGNYTLRAFQDFAGVEGAQIPLDVG